MKSESTSQVIVQYVGQQLGKPVDEHAELIDRGLLDSLLLTDLVLFIQVQFGIALGTEDVTRDNFRSIASLSEMIGRKQGECKVRAA